MPNEIKKRSAVGPDGVVDYNCCLQERRALRSGTGDAIDVDLKLGEDGVADIYINGCRHRSAFIDTNGDPGPGDRRSGGFCHKIRVGDKTFIVVIAVEERLVEVLADRHRRAAGIDPAPYAASGVAETVLKNLSGSILERVALSPKPTND